MWKKALVAPHPGGLAAVGQSQMGGHEQASIAAHAAGARAKAARALGGAAPTVPTPGAGNFKQHIASTLSAGGTPATVDDVHQAIGALTQAGHFTPAQGHGLMSHHGPLGGVQGLNTMAKIGGAVASMKKPPGSPA